MGSAAGAGAGAGAVVGAFPSGGGGLDCDRSRPLHAVTATTATSPSWQSVVRTPLRITTTAPGRLVILAAVRAILLFALGIAASACGSDIGKPCSLDDPCEDGICNLSGPGEPVCVELDGDLDSDGLPNRSDFCNVAPGGELDEDADGLADDCGDRCPIARSSGRDTDNDEVDHPCDPDPTVDGNRITVFEGFNSGALPAGWRAEGGTWEVRGGAAVFTATDPNATAVLTAPLPLSSRHIAVQAAYRIDRLTMAANQHLAGVTSIARLVVNPTTISCSGSRTGGMDALVVTSDSGAGAKPFANLFDPAALYRIAQLIDNATGSCAMDAVTQEGAVTATTPTDAPTEAGLSARAIEGRFPYLLIVQRPN